VCGMKTTYQCSLCQDDDCKSDEGWLCTTKKGKMCFPEHIATVHNTID
jgi:hypothetical protein